jgi:phytoene dehydrogenase-like protein
VTADGRDATRLDAIVVGAGIAGLVAASDLAQRGHRTLVVEHDHQAGGLMAGIRRCGFYFDAGCQSFEDMGIVFPLLEEYQLADLARFRRARYRVVMPGLDAVVESIPQIRAAFQRAYPESAAALGRVFDLHQRTSDLVGRLFAPGAVPFVRDGGPASLARWALRALSPGAGGALQQLGDLRTLLLDDAAAWYARQLPPSGARDLLAQCGYTRMNVFVASAFWHLWAHDYWYPEGGLQALFDRWVERLSARGVRFLFKRTVTALETQGDRVQAVRTQRGERFEAGEVVYTGDHRQLVHRLVGAERFGAAAVARLDETRHSDALVSVYLGLDLPREELRERLRTAHVFFFPRFDCRTGLDPGDPQAHRRAFLEVTAHGVEDATLAPPGKSAVVLQAFTRHDWQDGWGTGLTGDPGRGLPFAPRPAAYRRLKRQVAGELLEVFEQLVPGAGARVVFVDVGAPPSTVRFTRNAFGGSCGFELNWRNFPFASPLPHVRSPLENLHLAGHFTVWPGTVPTAALSGRMAALAADARLRRGRRARPAAATFTTPTAPAPAGAQPAPARRRPA